MIVGSQVSSVSSSDDDNDVEEEVPTYHLFAEADEAFQCIDSLYSSDPFIRRTSLDRLRTIYDKYLECPTLLDPALEAMVGRLVSAGRGGEGGGNGGGSPSILNNSVATTTAVFLNADFEERILRYPLSALYYLSKVRGRKVVQRFLPHGVDDVEPVWNALLKVSTTIEVDDDDDDDNDFPPLWESIYMLWNWMNALSLVPFDCSVLTGGSTSAKQQLVERAKVALYEAGPIRDAASACLASWLSRPDLEREELPAFLEWSKNIIVDQSYSSCSRSSNNNNSSDQLFTLMGVLRTTTSILKQSPIPRTRLVELFNPLWEPCLKLASQPIASNSLLLRKLLVKWWTRMSCAYLPPRIATWRYQRGNRISSFALQKTNNPGGCHVSDDAIPGDNKNAKEYEDELFDVPDQVEEGMGRLVESLGHNSTIVRWSSAKGIGRLTERLPSICSEDVLDAILEYFEDEYMDSHWHGACLALAELARRGLLLPKRLRDVVPHIVTAIHYDVQKGSNTSKSVGAHVRDAACYTFWAFSRAYSPSVLKSYMTELSEAIVITSLFDREVNCRRAASAAFQEAVGRQGSANFPHGIEILATADYFSLGNRKDAYTTIARKVASFGDEYRRPILRHLYREKLFHWDPMIRELSSKSLYTLTDLDPSYIAGVIVPYLTEKALDPRNLNVRHGAVLGVAETTLALAEAGSGILSGSNNSKNRVLTDKVLEDVVALVPTIEKKRLYRGRGGEIMRSAVCRLVECISIAQIPLTVQDQVKLLDSVDGSIPHPSELIQKSACLALHQLMLSYFPVNCDSGPTPRLQSRVVDKFIRIVNTSDNPAATRGYALALGYLPAKLVAPNMTVLTKVVQCLCDASRHNSLVGGESDAETRRNALLSINRIVETVVADNKKKDAGGKGLGYPVVNLESSDVVLRIIFDTYLYALEDYRSDRRGDVGSWSRLAAMGGLASLIISVNSSTEESGDGSDCIFVCDANMMTSVIAALLKQLSEKLDTVRQKAGECLHKILLPENPCIASIPYKRELITALGFTSNDHTVTVTATIEPDDYRSCWSEPSYAFPKVMNAASLGEDAYFVNVIAGISISVGGVTTAESVSKAAKSSLLEWVTSKVNNTNAIRNDDGMVMIAKLCNQYLSLLNENQRQVRVLLPVLKSINFLLTNRCLDEVLRKPRDDEETCSDYASLYQRAVLNAEEQCNDIHCLLTMIDVTVGLYFSLAKRMSVATHNKRSSLAFLCKMLAHRYPRIRSHAAEQLYLIVVEHVEEDDESMVVSEAILSTPWTSYPQDELRRIAKEVATGLGVLPEFERLCA